MQRFTNVLVVLDLRVENRALLDHATALCRRNQGRLTIVTVLDDLSRSTGVTSVWLKDLQTQLTEGQKTELNTVREAIQHQGIRADAAVLCGTPFLEIIRQVLRADHDLVMTAGEPPSAIGSFFLDSTIMNLMRKCPCPVWVIKPSQTDGFQRILAAVDPNPSDSVQEGLNRKILDLATSLARLNHSQLHIIHAWSMVAESLMRWSNISLSSVEMEGMMNETRALHESRVSALMAEYDLRDLDHQIHLLHGNPRKQITDMAETHKIELIVMGTVCRRGVAGLLIGNTAESVLRQVNCSVLAVKPEGFVTPVRLEDV